MRLHNLPLAFLFIFCFLICAASGAKYYPDDEEINEILDSSSSCSEEEEKEADEELFGSTPDGPSSASPHLFKSFEQLESTSEIWPDGFYRNMSICQHEIFPWKVYKLEGPDECPPNTTIAIGQYRNAQNESGWGILEVETFAPFSPELQAYAAGLVEGSLSKMQIYYHHKNTVSGLCKNQTEYCQKLYRYLADNLAWIKSQVMAKPPSDIYWRQVNLTFMQLTGINDGYGKEKDSGYVPHVQFYITPVFMLQLSGEIYDLDHLFKKQPNARQNAQMDDEDPGHCSGFVKVADGNKDLLMSHVAMAGYQTMNRVAKLYKFAYDKKNVPGNIVSFSGYAGVLASVDDYTLTSAGLLSVETTIAVFNESLYKEYVKPKGQLHCWIRSYISNQLAATAHDWVQIFAQHNSGTYNNQWTVTDFKRFKPGQELPTTDLVWILEQIPGTCVSRDVTWFLRKYGYWPSYNIPYLSKISELSGFSWKGNMNNWWRWGYSPRARIFQRDHGSVQNISTLQNLMRYNNYAHDEYSKCKCTPPYTAEAGISARGDLNPSNGTYEIPGMGFRNHGSLDYKGTNYELFKQMRLELIGGPTYGGPGNLPFFSWATTKVDAPHMGQPTNWKFKPFVTLWRTKVDVDMGEADGEE